MDNFSRFSTVTYGNAFSAELSLDTLRERVPAVFAPSAHERTSAKYTFIPTDRVLTGLTRAGFIPVDARQTQARKASPLHARHVIRLRRRMETISLRDSIPEVVLWNAHDGSGAYLRWILQCHHRGQNTSIARVLRYQSRNKGFKRRMVTLLGDLSANFAQARNCAEIRSCRGIGGADSIDAIGSAILLGVCARNRPMSSPEPCRRGYFGSGG